MPGQTPARVRKAGPPYREPETAPATREETRIFDEWDEEVRLVDYWRMMARRRWTVMAILLTVLAVTGIWTFSQTPVYRATSRIQIDPEDPNILSFQDAYAADLGNDGLQTQFEILEARTLARTVIVDLGLEENEELLRESAIESFAGRIAAFLPTGERDEDLEGDPLDPIVDAYLERLNISPVRQARLVDISFESEDPRFAAGVINTHADRFIRQNLRYRFEANTEAQEFLQENLDELKIAVEKTEDDLQAYSRDHAIIFSEDGESTTAEILQQLQTEHTLARAERFRRESYVELIRNGNAASIAQVANNELIAGLNAQLTDLRTQESNLAVDVGERMPARQRVRAAIEETQRLLNEEIAKVLDTVEAEYQVAVGREQLLAAEVERQREAVNQVNQEIIQYNILRREAEAAQRVYESLLNRLEEARVSVTLDASNIRIIDTATPPSEPVKPRKALNLLLALFVGLGLGVGAILVQEHLDDSIISADQVTEFLGVPTLGLVPKASSKGFGRSYAYGGAYGSQADNGGPDPKDSKVPALAREQRLEFVSHYEPMSLISEAYRSIRTSLLLSFPDNPPRSILVTSPSPGEGKTATALNVAISLTQTGATTLVVSTDMRKPRLDSLFSFPDNAGITGILTGSVSLDDSVCSLAIPNLYLLPCGTLPPNPAELLMSNRFLQLASDLVESFDYVVYDSPPVANVSDARILSHFVDCTIVVLRAASTSRHLAKHVLEQLSSSGSRTAGVILNDVDVQKGGYYDYGYGASSYTPYSS